MNNLYRLRRRTGLALFELLMMLILLGVIMTVGGQLFMATMRAGQSAGEAHDAAASFDAALAVLRGDVWEASRIDLAGGATSATIKSAGDRSITWTIAADGTLTRSTAGDAPKRSWSIPAHATFEAREPELILRLPATRSSAGGEVAMISQVQLLRRIAP
jgi:Tfp pilus assembly protein PilX